VRAARLDSWRITRLLRAAGGHLSRSLPPHAAAAALIAALAPVAASSSVWHAMRRKRRPHAALCEVIFVVVIVLVVVVFHCPSPSAASRNAPATRPHPPRRLLALPPVRPGHAHANSR